MPIARVFETLSAYMGSAYVNDFNILGRTYRVTVQADETKVRENGSDGDEREWFRRRCGNGLDRCEGERIE